MKFGTLLNVRVAVLCFKSYQVYTCQFKYCECVLMCIYELHWKFTFSTLVNFQSDEGIGLPVYPNCGIIIAV